MAQRYLRHTLNTRRQSSCSPAPPDAAPLGSGVGEADSREIGTSATDSSSPFFLWSDGVIGPALPQFRYRGEAFVTTSEEAAFRCIPGPALRPRMVQNGEKNRAACLRQHGPFRAYPQPRPPGSGDLS